MASAPKKLAFARKIMALPESGGWSPPGSYAYDCNNLVRCHPSLPILGRNIPPANVKQTHNTQPTTLRFMFVLYLAKTSNDFYGIH